MLESVEFYISCLLALIFTCLIIPSEFFSSDIQYLPFSISQIRVLRDNNTVIRVGYHGCSIGCWCDQLVAEEQYYIKRFSRPSR